MMLAVALLPGEARAQSTQSDKAAKEIELKRLDRDLDQGRVRAEALSKEIDALKSDRARLDRALIDAAARIKAHEARLSRSEDELLRLAKDEATFSNALAARRRSLADALAAMQRIGRSPPPALLAHPDDALGALRAALLLGGIVGDLKARAEALAADLSAVAALKRRISAGRAALAAEIAALAEERRRLASMATQKRRLQAAARKALVHEQARVERLSKDTRSLKELIGRMEKDMNGQVVDRRATFASKFPFSEARGRLSFPASGTRLTGFGDTDRFGVAAKGLSLTTRPGAQVTAPSDGKVVFAGTFRSYGQLLIINAGGGYHIVLAGMERIEVAVGQFVLAGEPVAVMGAPFAHGAAALAAQAAQPILYVEFRKDGAAIDPTPWWASKSLEKVRG